MFVKYMHLERIGNDEVDGIEMGTTYVFPKLDGTNASLWMDTAGVLQAGSRNRHLTEEADNAGFYKWALEQKEYIEFFNRFPTYTLYGEWLVPHSLKTYRDEAWRQFYVFDVFDRETGEHISYEDYQPLLETFGINYIAPINIIKNGRLEQYISCVEKNVHLIKDGMGVGEGVVIKNYQWKNKYGRTTWAKLVSNSFKEEHSKAMGAAVIGGELMEEKIINNYITQHLVDKVFAKIQLEEGGWSGKYIPRLLGEVWHDLITEEMWDILKKNKNPRIDFAMLNKLCIAKIKEIRKDIF